MVIYLSHLLVTPSTDIDHIHDAQFHHGGLRRLSGLRRRVRDAKREGKGVDFYGMNEKFCFNSVGNCCYDSQKMGLVCCSSSQNLDPENPRLLELWQEEFERRRLRLKHVVKLRQSSCCGLFGADIHLTQLM